MGYDRAGCYSWDRLDNLGRASADRIHPEWQEIHVGDRSTAIGEESGWWEVAALKPERLQSHVVLTKQHAQDRLGASGLGGLPRNQVKIGIGLDQPHDHICDLSQVDR